MTLSNVARALAAQMSWDGVFEELYERYEAGLALTVTQSNVVGKFG